MADVKQADEKKPKAEQRALVPNAEGNVIMEIIAGPYRGNYLTMTAADAEEAKDSHWARDPGETDRDHDHELTEEDRQSALTQAQAWAQAQWDAAAGIEQQPPPEGGEGGEGGAARRRNLGARPGSGYMTRTTETPERKT
jgi:hypothetical protein